MDTAFKVLDVLVSLLVVVAALVAAMQCMQKKLSTAAAWVMFGGLALVLVASSGYAVGNLVLVEAVGPDNFKVYRGIQLVFYLVNLLGLTGFGAGMAMFKPKTTQAQPEVSNG